MIYVHFFADCSYDNEILPRTTTKGAAGRERGGESYETHRLEHGQDDEGVLVQHREGRAVQTAESARGEEEKGARSPP